MHHKHRHVHRGAPFPSTDVFTLGCMSSLSNKIFKSFRAGDHVDTVLVSCWNPVLSWEHPTGLGALTVSWTHSLGWIGEKAKLTRRFLLLKPFSLVFSSDRTSPLLPSPQKKIPSGKARHGQTPCPLLFGALIHTGRTHLSHGAGDTHGGCSQRSLAGRTGSA